MGEIRLRTFKLALASQAGEVEVIDGYRGRTDGDVGRPILRVYTEQANFEVSLAKLLEGNKEAAARW